MFSQSLFLSSEDQALRCLLLLRFCYCLVFLIFNQFYYFLSLWHKKIVKCDHSSELCVGYFSIKIVS